MGYALTPADMVFDGAITPQADVFYNTMLDQNTVMNPPILPALDPPTVVPEPSAPVTQMPGQPVTVVTNTPAGGTNVAVTPGMNGKNLVIIGGVALLAYLLLKK